MNAMKSIEGYNQRRYECGEMLEYCRCGHESMFHFAELDLDDMDKKRWFECYKCKEEGKFCANFR